MRIKNVVKVMNFHALLRVDKAKKNAERYLFMQNELSRMLDIILNNKNFILDKKSLRSNPTGKVLNIYYGSDFGFCGNLNSVINNEILNDQESDKIIVGKKLRQYVDNVIYYIPREELEENMSKIEFIIHEAILDMVYKEINIIYLEYKTISEISFTKRRLFPTTFTKNEDDYDYNFSCEGNIEDILFNVLASYLGYQIRIADINCRASENIIRQSVTSSSLKKIDEIEEENRKQYLKSKKQKNFQKVVENYSKMKMF